jgi:hypothetical protein
VLEDEYPPDTTTAGDLVGINFDAPDEMLLQLRPASDRVQRASAIPAAASASTRQY